MSGKDGMSRWKRYPKCKDSGVEWLGEIPEEWRLVRLKFVCSINPCKSEIKNLLDEMYVSFLPMELIGEDHSLNLTETRNIKDVWNGYTYFRENDIILAKITPCFENGKCAICRGLTHGIGFGTTELHVLRPLKENLSNYFLYLIQSYSFKEIGKELMIGTAGQKRLPEEYVSNYFQGIPPFREQTTISTFLDRETLRIDTLIEKKHRQIELIQEKRAVFISQAVTKGLDPTVPMKDSGVNFLSKIPLNWVVVNFRNIVDSCAYGPRFSSDLYDENGNVALLRTTDLDEDGNISYVTLPLVQFNNEDFSRHYLKNNDLLITRSGTCGITSVFNEFNYPVLPGAFLIRFRLSSNVNPQYIRFFFNSYIGKEIIRSLEMGCVQKNLNTTSLFNIKLPLPSITEQSSILEYIDSELMYLSKIEGKIKKSIVLLKEYRSALISAAVTGKIDVRDTLPTSPEASS